MYTQFFKLKQSPFSIAPDPRYLFMSERHREALAHLLYGVGSGGGFVLLTGEIGAGKTTVCRCFIEQIPPDCKLAYIFNPKLTVEELLLSICDELGIVLAPHGAGAVSVKSYVDAINGYLLASHAQGKNNVLIIDEAQNLSADVLEQLRLLTNLETNERKLLQIILIGQPELRAMLARPELEQLAQRVIARYHLGSLSVAETGSYIGHRLAVAGSSGAGPFPRTLVARIHQLSKGVPRRINLLCDRALLGAYVENAPLVTRAILRKAAAEVFAGPALGTPKRHWTMLAAGLLAGATLCGAAAWQLLPPHGAAPAGARATPKPAPARAALVVPASTPSMLSAPAPAGASAAGSAVASIAVPAAKAAVPEVMPAAHPTADAALRELGALWGQPLPDGEPCVAALKLNLRCHQGKGGLYELHLLDRPAMIALHDGANPLSYALLTGMGENSVTLTIAGTAHVVSVAMLATRFDGEFTTFWSVPHTFREAITARDKGADVDWLASHLAQQAGLVAPAPNRPLDQALLRDFQARQNLKADGLAGPRTYMRLNQLGGVAEPRLLIAAGK